MRFALDNIINVNCLRFSTLASARSDTLQVWIFNYRSMNIVGMRRSDIIDVLVELFHGYSIADFSYKTRNVIQKLRLGGRSTIVVE